MWDVIRGLVEGGSTVLLTTQYLDEADQLAKRIAVIDRGKVVAEGTADELKGLVGNASLLLRVTDAEQIGAAVETIEQVLGATATITTGAGRLTAPMTDPERGHRPAQSACGSGAFASTR